MIGTPVLAMLLGLLLAAPAAAQTRDARALGGLTCSEIARRCVPECTAEVSREFCRSYCEETRQACLATGRWQDIRRVFVNVTRK